MSRFALVLLAGCASSSSFQTADVLRPGGWEAGGDVSAALIAAGGTGGVPWLVLPRAVVRVGLLKRMDLGASVGLDGVRLQPKFQLTRPGASGLIVSLAPGARILPLPDFNGGNLVLAGGEESLLVGMPFANDFQLVGLVRSAQDFTVQPDPVFLLWAGGSVGLSWQVLPNVRLMPEVGVMAPLFVSDGGEDRAGFSGAVVQLGIGVAAGRR